MITVSAASSTSSAGIVDPLGVLADGVDVGRPVDGSPPPASSAPQLLQAARELFIEKDYAEVSTEDVLRRATVSRGGLYHHFPSKRELYREVWRDSERRLIERLAATAKNPRAVRRRVEPPMLKMLEGFRP
jgi:AcrR family transcriptional regulator